MAARGVLSLARVRRRNVNYVTAILFTVVALQVLIKSVKRLEHRWHILLRTRYREYDSDEEGVHQ